MGGVDLTNRFVMDYQPSINGKKWYWCHFKNFLGLCRVAAWRASVLVRNTPFQEEGLNFLRQIVHGLMDSSVPQVLRHNGKRKCNRKEDYHFCQPAPKQGRCRVCKKNS